MKTHVSPARRVGLSLCAAMVCACGVASAQQGQWTVTNLHPLDSSGSLARAVTADSEVGYASYGPVVSGAVRYATLWHGTASSFVNLNPDGAFVSASSAADGTWQGGSVRYTTNPNYDNAALWQGSAASFIDLHPSNADSSIVSGISGSTQVGWCFLRGGNGGPRASLWRGSAATWTDLNAADMLYSFAEAAGDGEQVGSALIGSDGIRAILWHGTAESWTNLHPSGSQASQAYGVNGGEQVGFADRQSEEHAALWRGTAESFVDLHPPLGELSGSYAWGVYAGQQVGRVYVRSQPNGAALFSHASLWSGTASSWVDLHQYLPEGFSDSNAYAIWSDDKFIRVVGNAYSTVNARDEAMLWTYTRPPCTADFNADGFLDFTDFDAFVVAFESGDVASDINGDGFLDVSDFDAFVDAFEAGC